jgi:hypothetical protein
LLLLLLLLLLLPLPLQLPLGSNLDGGRPPPTYGQLLPSVGLLGAPRLDAGRFEAQAEPVQCGQLSGLRHFLQEGVVHLLGWVGAEGGVTAMDAE